ncbi:hypothetical protein I7I51_00180 [Histoplasma capsulatum]|uniref:Uncharacterized protein n=1 Tax=Ajellomyces capsulatus TaxID=5037 RepID=A0A8A1MEL2_AJECA|nr:hypothetical protein I7I51_00180 [Histoplasma capsulatum]
MYEPCKWSRIIVAFRRANETELATFQRHCHQEAETPLLPGVNLSRRAYRLTCASISKAMHRLANLAMPRWEVAAKKPVPDQQMLIHVHRRFVKMRVSRARLPPYILRKYEEIETSTLKDKVLSSRSEMIDFINKRSKVTTESGNERGLEKVHGERPINEWHASNNLMLLTRDDEMDYHRKRLRNDFALLDGSDDQSQSFLIARHSNKKPHELAAKMILPRHPKLVHPDGEDPPWHGASPLVWLFLSKLSGTFHLFWGPKASAIRRADQKSDLRQGLIAWRISLGSLVRVKACQAFGTFFSDAASSKCEGKRGQSGDWH